MGPTAGKPLMATLVILFCHEKRAAVGGQKQAAFGDDVVHNFIPLTAVWPSLLLVYLWDLRQLSCHAITVLCLHRASERVFLFMS